MTERIRRDLVSFLHPFTLSDVEGPLPPGNYLVETTEEELDGLSMVAFRRLNTTIELPAQNVHPRARSSQIVEIDPTDLQLALNKDLHFQPAEAQS